MNKADSEKKHFDLRCYERLGILLDSSTINNIIRDIQSSKLTSLGKITNRLSNFLIEISNKKYVVGYDKDRKTLVTIYEYRGKGEVRIKKERIFNPTPLYSMKIVKEYATKHNMDIHTARAVLELKCKKSSLTKEELEIAKNINFNEIKNNLFIGG